MNGTQKTLPFGPGSARALVWPSGFLWLLQCQVLSPVITRWEAGQLSGISPAFLYGTSLSCTAFQIYTKEKMQIIFGRCKEQHLSNPEPYNSVNRPAHCTKSLEALCLRAHRGWAGRWKWIKMSRPANCFCPRAGFNEPVPNELSLQLASGLNRWGRDSAKFLIGFSLVLWESKQWRVQSWVMNLLRGCGWLSILSTRKRKTWLLIETLASALHSHPPDQLIWSGWLDDLCFSDLGPGPWPPRRIHLQTLSRRWLESLPVPH